MSESDRKADHLELAARLERKRVSESRQAQALIEQFAADAVEAGVEPERLTARSYTGSTRYRTNLTGWYLKRDRSVAVGTDGRFYLMHAPASLVSLVRGVTMTPSDPPLELGRGARDGESMPLTDALAARLAAGNSWPQ